MEAIGIIGGTGLSSIESWTAVTHKSVSTRFGSPSASLAFGELNGRPLVFLPRHGEDHSVPPHKINYRANMCALKEAGVATVVAVAAVGGIAEEAPPASLVLPHQLIDYTYGREHTFSDGENSPLNHVDFTEPYSASLRTQLSASAASANVACVTRGVYGATQGPRLETAAEIDRLERDGCTIVGMTGMPEAALARELDMAYACCAVVVNWAAGRSSDTIDMAAIMKNVAIAELSIKKLLSRYFQTI